MGSFSDGMRMGQGAYQQMLGNQRQKERDARTKVVEGREDELYARNQAQLQDEDEAVKNYGLLTTRGKANEPAIQANREANQAGLDSAVNDIMQGQPVAQPQYAPLQQEYTPASDLDKNQGLQAISRARRDWNGVASLQKEEKTLAWDNDFGTRLKSYTGSDEQIGSAATYINSNSKRVSMGAPEKGGVIRMSVVQPDGRAEFLKLSKQDQAQLYAAAGMMDRDPIKALTVMSGVNKSLAEAIAADNGIEFKLAEVADKAAGRAETGRHNRAIEADSSARVGLARTASTRLLEFVDPSGETVLLDPNQLKFQPDGTAVTPAGLRPKTARSPDDTKAYQEALMTLGPRPAQRTGMFGGTDDKAGQQWDQQRGYVEQVFGRGQGRAPMSATDRIIAERLKNQQQTQPQDQGLSGLSNEQLAVMARKPRGVSSAEAAEAQRELDNRQSGAPTLKAW